VIADIKEHVQLSSVGKTTHYMQHIGGTWYVSVDSKFLTVDIRRWYKDLWAGSSLKPTGVGIVLTNFNWEKLKKVIVEVEDELARESDRPNVLRRVLSISQSGGCCRCQSSRSSREINDQHRPQHQ